MTVQSQEAARMKSDKALVLHDAGLVRSAIAERLGVKPCNVAGMIQRARERREKAGEGRA